MHADPAPQHELPQQFSPSAQQLPPQTPCPLGQHPFRALGSSCETHDSPESQHPEPGLVGSGTPHSLGQQVVASQTPTQVSSAVSQPTSATAPAATAGPQPMPKEKAHAATTLAATNPSQITESLAQLPVQSAHRAWVPDPGSYSGALDPSALQPCLACSRADSIAACATGSIVTVGAGLPSTKRSAEAVLAVKGAVLRPSRIPTKFSPSWLSNVATSIPWNAAP